MTLAAGESVRLFANLKPPVPLPEPGGDVEVTLVATAGELSGEASASINFPELWAPRVSFSPAMLFLEPGGAGEIEVTIEGLGNAAGALNIKHINRSDRLRVEGDPRIDPDLTRRDSDASGHSGGHR